MVFLIMGIVLGVTLVYWIVTDSKGSKGSYKFECRLRNVVRNVIVTVALIGLGLGLVSFLMSSGWLNIPTAVGEGVTDNTRGLSFLIGIAMIYICVWALRWRLTVSDEGIRLGALSKMIGWNDVEGSRLERGMLRIEFSRWATVWWSLSRTYVLPTIVLQGPVKEIQQYIENRVT